MVKFRVIDSWRLVPLWEGLRKIEGLSCYFYAILNGSIAIGENPSGQLTYITGEDWFALHRDTLRFYVLVGKRPFLFLIVVEAGIPEELIEGIIYMRGELSG